MSSDSVVMASSTAAIQLPQLRPQPEQATPRPPTGHRTPLPSGRPQPQIPQAVTKRHRCTLTDGRGNPCTYACDKKSHLTRHMKSALPGHSAEKIYRSRCNKEFTRKDNRDQHETKGNCATCRLALHQEEQQRRLQQLARDGLALVDGHRAG